LNQPVISFCVPTYNRARYLDRLLAALRSELPGLRHSYEIVVSDNGSTDGTGDVVAAHAQHLPIRYIRRERNHGAQNNWTFVQEQARGVLQLYVADDDMPIVPEINAIADIMLRDPGIGVVYAPWYLHDLVANQTLCQFYGQKSDVLVERGDLHAVASYLLENGIFPEIYMCRRDVRMAVRPRVNDQAYWAFVHAAEYVSCARVLFRKEPFYISITDYFAEEEREQAGAVEAVEAWDRYRGGLEYLVSRLPAVRDDPASLSAWTAHVQRIVADRMAVAVRLRLYRKLPMVDTYYIAARVASLGYARLLPVPLADIAAQAALEFLCRDELLLDGVDAIACAPGLPPAARDYLAAHAPVPVRFDVPLTRDAWQTDGTLVCIPGSILDLPAELALHRPPRLIGLGDLTRKFA